MKKNDALSMKRGWAGTAAAVAIGMSTLGALAAPVAAQVRAPIEQGRRPLGPRIASAVTQFSSNSTSCAVNGDGTVRCWGNSAAITRVGPVPLSDAAIIAGVTGAVSVTVGNQHACALRSDGKVLCWGTNSVGQLGRPLDDGDPQEVPGLTNAVNVAAGGFHTCAVVIGGDVVCWGLNQDGQLGRPPNNSSNPPEPVQGLLAIRAVVVTAGTHHTCVLGSVGEVSCWGGNDFHQLTGSPSNLPGEEPHNVGLSNVVDIAAGFQHTCAVIADGSARCWGRNLEGELGTGDGNTVSGVAEVQGLSNLVSLAAGFRHTCGLISNGTLRCWGLIGTSTSFVPFQPEVIAAIGIAAGLLNSCALSAIDAISCFSGPNPPGTADGIAPISGRGIGAGIAHSCARRADGSFACWGENASGQLGNGFPTDRSVPGTVVNATNARIIGSVIAAGGDHSCSTTTAGTARCWGDNAFGQTGDPDRSGVRPAPEVVIDQGKVALTNIIALANGDSHSCALLANGRAKCWGSNANGQLGDGTHNAPALPTNTVFVRTASGILENIKAIAAGSRHTCALLANGGVSCWGANEAGQATGTATPRTDAVFAGATGQTGIALAAGAQHTCVVSSVGHVACWGLNASGQLGPGVDNAVGVAAGDAHTCAVRADGTVVCWGSNASGQLGNEGSASSSDPVTVKERRVVSCPIPPGVCSVAVSLARIVSVEAGAAHTCAIRGDGQPFCWGDDSVGQVGNGSPNADQSVAQPVSSFNFNVDPNVTLIGHGQVARVTALANCDASQHVNIRVTLTQGDISSSGTTAGRCSGGVFRYELQMPSRGPGRFVAGPATAAAEASIVSDGIVVEHPTWTRQVVLTDRTK